MKSGNKKSLLLSCSLAALISGWLISPTPIWAEEDLPSRDIYVVYDDSGSMYRDYTQDEEDPIDTWSKAKYSMEVFASMLSPDDTMKIYYMSDYSKNGDKSGPRLILEGEDDAQANVLKIRNEKTRSGDTPFETVEEAYDDLQKADGEEKWLVVLSDGKFLNGNDTEDEEKEKLNKFLNNKDSDISVIFLGLGKAADHINENRDEEIYSERAENADQIFGKVTEVFNRVFNTSNLKTVRKDGTFTLDVPMSQITVFVQGNDSEIISLVDENGKSIGNLDSIVDVETNEESDNTHPNYLESHPKDKLEGAVAVFDGDFAPGTYQIKTKNAAQTEIYYKPNLALTAWLEDSSGNKIDQMKDLPSGDYTIHFELISGLDQSPLPANNIVNKSGDLEYEAVVKNNGKQLDGVYKDGDTIHVNEGELDLDVTATFMRYNRVTDHLSLSAFDDKTVTFETEGPFEWSLGRTLVSAKPDRLIMKVQDQTPTVEEWAQVSVPEITVNTDTETQIDVPMITKSEEPGVFLIEPQKDQTDFELVPYSAATLSIRLNQIIDQIPWQGEQNTEVAIKDNRAPWIQHGKLILHILEILLAIIGLIGLLLLYRRKNRLPKIPHKLNIDYKPASRRYGKRRNEYSTFDVDRSSVWKLWKDEEASFNLLPEAADIYLPNMNVKAVKDKKMEVQNPEDFKEGNVEIDGVPINRDTEQFPLLDINSCITVNAKSGKYELYMNIEYSEDEE